jgi:hypothetical protein
VTVRPATTDDDHALSFLFSLAGLIPLDPCFAIRPSVFGSD